MRLFATAYMLVCFRYKVAALGQGADEPNFLDWMAVTAVVYLRRS
jgi:hypothetical protein